MKSPCISICEIDDASGLCIGCGRTLDEIAKWRSMTDEERLRVLAVLPERMAAAQLQSLPSEG